MKYLLSILLILTFGVSTSFGQVVSNGDQFSLLVPVKNNGPETEPNAKMPFTIPAGIKYVSSSPTKGFYTVGDSTWYVGKLTSGEEEEIDITFEVTDLNQAPYSISVTATGDGNDTIAGNNDSTFTIQAITDTVTATAVSYSYGCVCDNVSENDTLCNFCDTKFLLDSGSYVNGTIIRFDTLTGEYLFQLDNPNDNGSFDYDIVCYNCGDGNSYAQNTATQTVYALFTAQLSGDTSQLAFISGGDTVQHTAGGTTTNIALDRGTIVDGTVYPDTTGGSVFYIEQKDGTVTEVDFNDVYKSGEILTLDISNSGNLSITQYSGNDTTSISRFLTPVNDKNTELKFYGDSLFVIDDRPDSVGTLITNSTTITNLVDSHIVDAQVTEIDSTNKRLVLVMNNGDSITALFKDYRGAAGSGDDWGSQVVQRDSTLLGNGTLGNELSVSAANNALVSNYAISGNDIVLTLTDGTVFTLTQAALRAAIDTDTNTTELTNVSIANDTLKIEDDNQVWEIDLEPIDSTELTSVSFTNDSLLIQDDKQTWVADLEPLRTTSLAWSSITSRPTINASGGNITGSLDLDAETLTLTYNDVDTNYYLDSFYLAGDNLTAEVIGFDTFVVDLSSYDNSSLGYSTGDTLRTMTSTPYPIDLENRDKHVEIIEHTASSVGSTVSITALRDVSGATLVVHIDEDETVSFANYFVEPNLTTIGIETLTRNTTMVFDVVPTRGELGATTNGNILVRRQ